MNGRPGSTSCPCRAMTPTHKPSATTTTRPSRQDGPRKAALCLRAPTTTAPSSPSPTRLQNLRRLRAPAAGSGQPLPSSPTRPTRDRRPRLPLHNHMASCCASPMASPRPWASTPTTCPPRGPRPGLAAPASLLRPQRSPPRRPQLPPQPQTRGACGATMEGRG